MLYKVDAPYSPDGEGGILWNDPELGVEWPVSDPIVSARDEAMPTFAAHRAAQAAQAAQAALGSGRYS